ncbi:hypothetical protein NEOC65_001091 [Neochlamydia sp. AcF65]|nr:hypothetical protein [Neochlamydia sp. AcF65]
MVTRYIYITSASISRYLQKNLRRRKKLKNIMSQKIIRLKKS